ncbi:adenylosuccinate synthase [bacterium 3DAC]|nr:adenylosuccinate synthase [Dictyoglomota bacterium]UZN23077.1 adenylosuccinate synthase [bacterium 3DAC]
MKASVIGLSWGDEGKGKIVDMLRDKFDFVVRYSGGDNAGHTVVRDGTTYKFHILPSSILEPTTVSVIGAGTVINPYVLKEEYDRLPADHGKLLISRRAHIVFKTYRHLDVLIEDMRDNKIGTTKRGIGPAYAMKMYRLGIRVGDFIDNRKLETHYNEIARFMKTWGLDMDDDLEELKFLAQFVAPMVADVEMLLWKNREKKILFEGAQGYMLDIDMGTYPYVTSSHPGLAGIVDSGFPPYLIDRRIGVVKAYATRVGEGIFPTELTDDIGEFIREKGHEYGATTGRPRRCGWLDLVQTRFAVFMNGINELAITKLDVLSGLEKIRAAVAYEIDGEKYDFWPENVLDLNIIPVYEELEGWEEDIFGVTEWRKLPIQARRYVEFIEDHLEVRVRYISTGPAPEHTIEIV